MEDGHRIVLAHSQTKRVKVHRASHFGVHTAEIDDELVVDEHPHVVVAAELEELAATIREAQVDLTREEKVVHARAIVRSHLVEALSVEREVLRVRVRRDVRRRVIVEREVLLDADVDARYVLEPLRHCAAIVEHARVHRLPVRQRLARGAAGAKATCTDRLAIGA